MYDNRSLITDGAARRSTTEFVSPKKKTEGTEIGFRWIKERKKERKKERDG
jgi:hypothetical protein